jgi:hypothetical protein
MMSTDSLWRRTIVWRKGSEESLFGNGGIPRELLPGMIIGKHFVGRTVASSLSLEGTIPSGSLFAG